MNVAGLTELSKHWKHSLRMASDVPPDRAKLQSSFQGGNVVA
jgi:hypothetical protein